MTRAFRTNLRLRVGFPRSQTCLATHLPDYIARLSPDPCSGRNTVSGFVARVDGALNQIKSCLRVAWPPILVMDVPVRACLSLPFDALRPVRGIVRDQSNSGNLHYCAQLKRTLPTMGRLYEWFIL